MEALYCWIELKSFCIFPENARIRSKLFIAVADCKLDLDYSLLTHDKQSLSEKENILSSMAGHQNRKQKLAYLEKIRDENTQLANERNKYQAGLGKLKLFKIWFELSLCLAPWS